LRISAQNNRSKRGLIVNKFALVFPHTTGPELDNDEIIQLGYKIYNNGEAPLEQNTIYAINRPISRAAKARTGLSKTAFDLAQTFKSEKSKIVHLLNSCERVFVLSFSNEKEWISDYLGLGGTKTVDLIALAQYLLPEIESFTRSDLYFHFFKKPLPHKTLQPMLDISAKIIESIVRKIEDDERQFYRNFHEIANLSGDALLIDICHMIKQRSTLNIFPEGDLFSVKKKEESNEEQDRWDKTAASLLQDLWSSQKRGPGIESQAEPTEPISRTNFPSNDLISEMLSEKGLLKEVENYQPRPSQIRYAQEVNNCLKEHPISFIEGETGIGKSMGYLLPSMELLSRNPKMQIVVSTATKNLQTQLLEREVPKLGKKYSHIKVALLKGKGNYICLTALERAYKQWLLESDSSEQRLAWIYLVNLLHSRPNAVLDSVPRRVYNWIPSIKTLLKETNAATHCKKGFCNIDHDYYGRALQQALQAQLIVTNHYKLAVLNEELSLKVNHYIIDEADQWERSCQSAFSDTMSSRDIRDILYRLGGGKRRGYLDLVQNYHDSKHGKKNQDISENAGAIIDGALASVKIILEQMRAWHIAFQSTLTVERTAYGKRDAEYLLEKVEGLKDGKQLQTFCELLSAELSSLENLLKSISGLKHIKSTLRNRARVYELIVQELAAKIKSLAQNFGTEEVAHALVLHHPSDFTIKRLQVSVAELIKDKFYQGDNRVLYTSASLSLNGDFTHFKKAYGASSEDVHLKAFQSGLNLEDRAVAYVDYSIPLYDYRNKEAMNAWRSGVDRAIAKYVLAANGRSLILWTSHSDMLKSFRTLQTLFTKHDILPLIQNGSSEEEIDEFRRNEFSVLFGVDRFWSGVDFPGETLSQVIIVKAPNPSLGDPIIQHRNIHEPMFMRKSYGVMSKLKLKQGAGRLIRHEHDNGGIIILDGRYIHSPWLTDQLSVLPVKYQVSSDQHEILLGVLKKSKLEDEFISRKLDFSEELIALKNSNSPERRSKFTRNYQRSTYLTRRVVTS
jgi:ATP-dependent DNA helicase DinG